MRPYPTILTTALRAICCIAFTFAIAAGQTTSSVTVTTSPNPASYGQPVTLDATVTTGATGKVTFYDGTTVLGIATISNSHAILTTTLLASGTRSLRAYYAGNSTYSPSTSPVVSQTVVAGASLGFRRAVTYPLPSSPTFSAVGDFNGDGIADIAVSSSSGIAVLLGNGDGTLRAAVNYTATGAVTGILAADLNGDGKTDLIAGSGSNVSVLLGNGDGTFAAPVSYRTGEYVNAIASGDFNGDGKVDVVTVSYNGGKTIVLLGNGDGTLSSAVNYTTPNALSVAVADINKDGTADLIVGGYGGVRLLLGQGDGTFQAGLTYSTASSYVYSVAVGDFNGDGNPDIAATVYYSYNLAVLFGNGDGTFQYTSNTPAPYGTRTVAVGDFNGDGKLDFATVSDYNNDLNVVLGNGDGTFQSAVVYQHQRPLVSVAVADWNADGIPDLALVSNSDPFLVVRLGGAITDLTVTSSRGGFTQGQTGAVYTSTVTNVGDFATSSAVGVARTLPAGFVATSIAGNGWTCVLNTLTCTRSDTLAPGNSYPPITVTVNIPSNVTGNVTSTAIVAGGGDQNPANNTATDTAFVRYYSATTLSATPNPATLGTAVTLTATVTTGATGKVTFYDGASVLGVSTISGQQASLTTSLLPSGTRALRAQFSGDSTYGPSISATWTQTVNASAVNGFQPRTNYKTGGSPQTIATADFNRDGKSDIVTYDYYTGGISVLLGNGDGTFRPAASYAASSNASELAVGDFNRDGNPDVVVAGYGTLFVLLGNGDGTLQNAVRFNTNLYANFTSFASTDFDGDGKPDLIATANGVPMIFFGNGDGTFQAPASIPTNGIYFGSTKIADLNGDGRPDLLSISSSSGVLISQINNGDGTFQSPQTYSSSYIANSPILVVGDFNGDGKPDAAVLYANGIVVFPGNGDGTFRAAGNPSATSSYGYSGIAGDFNSDGKLDILYTNYYGAYLAAGKGDGTFQSPAIYSTDGYSSSSAPAIVLADFNGDGKPDFAVVGNNVNVFLGGQFSGLYLTLSHTGNFTTGKTGTYQIVVTNPFFAATSSAVTITDALPAGLTATALSGSSWTCSLTTVTCTRSDALGTGASYSAISLTVNVSSALSPSTLVNRATVTYSSLLNTAYDSTTIVSPSTTTLNTAPNPSTLGQPVTLTAAVLPSSATGRVQFLDGGVFFGSAPVVGGQATLTTRSLPPGVRRLTAQYTGDSIYAGSVSSVRSQTVNASQESGLGNPATYATGTGPQAMAASDFNGDGYTDLVTVNQTANSVSVLLSNGDGTFRAKVDYPVGAGPRGITVSDFNNDGKIDLAVANSNDFTITILLGNGDGTFQTGATTPLDSYYVYRLAAGDFNGDGKADLVITGSSCDYAWILLGNGDGTFGSPRVFHYCTSTIAVGDWNLDGKLDVATAYGAIYSWLGNGDGTLQDYRYTSANYPSALAVGDLNGDGKPDLIASENGGATVFLGVGDGNFQNGVHYTTGNTPSSVAITDANGDGKLDVVITNKGSNNVSVLYGNGDGTLQTPINYNVGSQPYAVVAGEFNGDGRADLAIANYGSNNVTVLLGILTPVINITSTHAQAFALGQTGAVYTLTVTNNGPGSTSGTVTVTDTLPTGLTATSMTGTGWSCTLGTLTCTRADVIAPGASYPPITLTVNVAQNTASLVANLATVSGGSGIGSTTIDTTSVSATVLSVSKTHTGNFAQGQTGATYSIVVTNAAGLPSSGTVTVTDTVPNGMTLVSMSGTGWTCTPSGNTCTRADALAVGSSYPAITVTVNVATNAPVQLTNTAAVSGGNSASASVPDPTSLYPFPRADFNLDHNNDIIWQDSVTGLAQVWLLGGTNGVSLIGSANLTVSNTWRVVGVGDFNNDGRPDVVWQDPVTGAAQVWFLGGASGNVITGVAVLSNGNSWRIRAVADFNNDGHPDMIWQDQTSGLAQIWFLGGAQGTTVTGAVNLTTSNTWRIVGAADFNQDGNMDVLWQDPVTGMTQVWYLGGAQHNVLTNAVNLTGSNTWQAAAIADYNGDGRPDVIFQDPSTGASQVYCLGGPNGVTILNTYSVSGSNTWRIVGPR